MKGRNFFFSHLIMATVIIMLSNARIKEAAQSESAPSNDYVKQFAATLLHNERLFILFPGLLLHCLEESIYRPAPVCSPLCTFHSSVDVYIAGTRLRSETADKASR